MFSVFLIASLIVALTLGPVSATASEGNGPGMSYNALPGPKDLEISADEDEAFLNGVLKSIFPEGTGGMSDEQKGISILRYASSALELKNNGGTATKIIREGYAICGGLSHVHRVLCRMVGLPSRYIGAFNLRPIMGSHAISEVYYGGKWHLLDPTFGIFFYSKTQYDGTGEIPSFHDLVTSPGRWTAFKVVERPWIGRYDDSVRSFGVAPVEADYLKDVYRTPIMELYRKVRGRDVSDRLRAPRSGVLPGRRGPERRGRIPRGRRGRERRGRAEDGDERNRVRGRALSGRELSAGVPYMDDPDAGAVSSADRVFQCPGRPARPRAVSVEGGTNRFGSEGGEKGRHRPSRRSVRRSLWRSIAP